MKKNKIKFGTDGWRGEIAKDFTFKNIEKVSLAFVQYLKKFNLIKNGIAVGYDNRFQSEDFARVAASICSNANIKTFYSEISLPSPALSYFVNTNKLDGGIMITASHNPSNWNGFKIKESFGGSAKSETTKEIEAILEEMNEPNYPYQPQQPPLRRPGFTKQRFHLLTPSHRPTRGLSLRSLGRSGQRQSL